MKNIILKLLEATGTRDLKVWLSTGEINHVHVETTSSHEDNEYLPDNLLILKESVQTDEKEMELTYLNLNHVVKFKIGV